jgi:hypothetical protein
VDKKKTGSGDSGLTAVRTTVGSHPFIVTKNLKTLTVKQKQFYNILKLKGTTLRDHCYSGCSAPLQIDPGLWRKNQSRPGF